MNANFKGNKKNGRSHAEKAGPRFRLSVFRFTSKKYATSK